MSNYYDEIARHSELQSLRQQLERARWEARKASEELAEMERRMKSELNSLRQQMIRDRSANR